jgi:tetratricopeptide (TPR) repeat protein/Cdc6-like AAA superfamily ATPase
MLKRLSTDPAPAQPAPSFGLTDAATAEDKLGYQMFADRLADSIARVDPANTPWTIGVYGSWGSGKTSFLMMTASALLKRFNIEPIWFNAWKYTREEDLWLALIQTILERASINGRLRAPWVKLRIWTRSVDLRSGAWEVVRRLAVLALRVALLVLAVLMFASVASPGKHDAIDAALSAVLGQHPALARLLASPRLNLVVAVVALIASNPASFMQIFSIRLGIDFSKFSRRSSYRDKIAFLDHFSRDFSDIVHIVCKDKPLVIIIDDLDRCLPDQTLQILETVKLFLDVRGCVFLLAVDREIVEQAIAVRYKDMPPSGAHLRIGETYFEKVVQLPFSLPPAADSKVSEFIQGLSGEPAVHTCIPILRGPAPYNPRRIKRSIQTFGLLRDFAASALPDEVLIASLLAKLVVLQAYYREVYDDVHDDPMLLGRLERHYRADGAAHDAALDATTVALAERYDSCHPGLADLLRLQVGDADSFDGVRLVDYLTFVRSIVVETSPVVDLTPSAESKPSRPARFLVVYTDTDQRWAEWIVQQLSHSGYTAALGLVSAGSQAYDFAMIVLSESADSAEITAAVAEARAFGVEVLAVRVQSCETPDSLSAARIIDLASMGQSETARLALLSGIPTAARLSGDIAVPPTVSAQPGGMQINADAYGPAFSTTMFPGRSAAISNVPPYYSDILGRPAEITSIASFFASKRSAGSPAICAIVGLGGSGKSTIATQYAHEYARGASVIWYFRCTDAETIVSGFEALAVELGVSGAATEPRATAAAVLSRLADLPDWLLVYDDIVDAASLEEYLPRAGTGRVLLTSRDRSTSRYAGHTLQLDVLSIEDSARMLQTISGSDDADGLRDLAEELGRLPLALHQAGRVMRAAAISPRQYLRQYRANPARRLASSDAFPESIVNALKLSAEQIDKTERAVFANAILRLLAFLAPEEVPRQLVMTGVITFALEPGVPFDDVDLDDSLALLGRYSLVALTPKGISMHRLIQQAIRLELSTADSQSYAAGAVRAILQIAPAAVTDPAEWSAVAALAAHIQVATGYAEHLEIALEDVGAARELLTRYLLSRGAYVLALQAGQECLRVMERQLGADSPAVARVRTLLAAARRAAGDLEGARSDQEAALAIQERVLGNQHPDVAISLQNLARILLDSGDAAAARAAQETALSIFGEALGTDTPEAAVGMANLARIQLRLGEVTNALQCQQHALSIQEKLLGPDHPDVAISLSSLAVILLQSGSLERARACAERALDIQQRLLGPDHPVVAETLTAVAWIAMGSGDVAQAKALQERALDIQERALGPDHPDVAVSLDHLAVILAQMDDITAAEEARQRAAAISGRSLDGSGTTTTGTAPG